MPSGSKDQDQINVNNNSTKYLQDEIRNCGILEANVKHWRTMPDFKSMFSSNKDIFMFFIEFLDVTTNIIYSQYSIGIRPLQLLAYMFAL